MRVVGSFDPSAAKSGTIQVGAADGGAKILLYNRSLINLKLDFENGKTDLLHAGEARWWEVDAYTPEISWSQFSFLSSATPPISEVSVTVYDPEEDLGGSYPMSLVYQMNVGNNVPISSSNTSIINDGNAAGTVIVEATPNTRTSSAVTLTNDGVLTLGDTTNNQGSANIHGSLYSITADIYGNLTFHSGTHTIQLQNTGSNNLNVLIDGVQVFQISSGGIDLSIAGGAGLLNLNTLGFFYGTNTGRFTMDSSGNLNFDRPNGTRIFQINAGGIDLKTNGNILATTKVQYTTGSVSGITKVTGTTVANTVVLVNHGLTTTPDFVDTTIVSSTSTVTYSTTKNSTQVGVFCPTGGLPFECLCHKF